MRRLANLQAETEAGLIVIDVLSDMAAGIDENGREFGHAFNLVRSLPCAVLALHHSGKDKSKGARGTSSLRAATDIEIEVSDAPLPNGDGSILMTAIYLKSRKNRNEDPMPDLALDLRKPDDDYPQPVIIGRHLEASDAKGVDPSSQLAKVLDAIVAKGREGCSRTSLAEDLGVSRPTVREHVEKLLTRDFIEETPGGRSKILTATRAGVAAIEGSRRVANPPPGDAMGGSRPPIGAVHPSLPANQEPTIEEILEDLARQEGDDIDLDIEHDGPLDRDAVIRAMLSALGE
jgi:DNA-binding MarR family transcriptional regulator